MSDETKLLQDLGLSLSNFQNDSRAHSSNMNTNQLPAFNSEPGKDNCWIKMSECDDFIGPK